MSQQVEFLEKGLRQQNVGGGAHPKGSGEGKSEGVGFEKLRKFGEALTGGTGGWFALFPSVAGGVVGWVHEGGEGEGEAGFGVDGFGGWVNLVRAGGVEVFGVDVVVFGVVVFGVFWW